MPVGIVLSLAAPIDIAGAAVRHIAWDTAYDNTYDFNVITEVPDGLGMTIPLDGMGTDFTTTTAGVWWFSLDPAGTPLDATLGLFMGLSHAGDGLIQGASTEGAPGVASIAHYGEVVYLPAGAVNNFRLDTTVAATAGSIPTTPQATIVRLG
jgi:hypothetical protein